MLYDITTDVTCSLREYLSNNDWAEAVLTQRILANNTVLIVSMFIANYFNNLFID